MLLSALLACYRRRPRLDVGRLRRRGGNILRVGLYVLMGIAATAIANAAPPPYRTITASQTDKTIVLTGRDLTIEQVVQVAGSINEFGFVNPILVGPDNVIIAGHARFGAAQKLGLTEVPVIVLRHLSEAQRRALVIADNRLALNAGWDEKMLRIELLRTQCSSFLIIDVQSGRVFARARKEYTCELEIAISVIARFRFSRLQE